MQIWYDGDDRRLINEWSLKLEEHLQNFVNILRKFPEVLQNDLSLKSVGLFFMSGKQFMIIHEEMPQMA